MILTGDARHGGKRVWNTASCSRSMVVHGLLPAFCSRLVADVPVVVLYNSWLKPASVHERL
jgi:hypothetical protein